MGEFDYARLIYLGILVSVLVFWFIVHNRHSLGKTAQMALAWGLIFLGVIAAFGLWDDISQTVRPRQSALNAQGQISVPRAPDGHYYLTLNVNDQPVEFLIDTGATDVVLTQSDAARIGLDPNNLNYYGRAMTANGEVRTAPVDLKSIALGDVVDKNVTAWVNQGDQEQSLLGMAYLQRWSHISIGNNALILTR
ncbi:MAG: TIGR02281 family clan AA aspartic protease [Rhodobacteraceae bacterium]|nr:TIGR02281 family clan AA aspartic protease [Paracoccaceae bacterium]